MTQAKNETLARVPTGGSDGAAVRIRRVARGTRRRRRSDRSACVHAWCVPGARARAPPGPPRGIRIAANDGRQNRPFSMLGITLSLPTLAACAVHVSAIDYTINVDTSKSTHVVDPLFMGVASVSAQHSTPIQHIRQPSACPVLPPECSSCSQS